MFTSLHELAKRATLMITIAPEGADQLRVNVTPVPSDSKAKTNLPMPLSLVATPAEFDADFGAALLTWHAPKRSLIEQAQAAGGAPAAAPALPAPKSESKNEKPGRKGRGKAGASEEAAPAHANGEAIASADQVTAESAQAGADEQAPAVSTEPADGVNEGDLQSEGSQQAAPAPAADASTYDVVANAAPVEAAPTVGQEAVDKFTLDLF